MNRPLLVITLLCLLFQSFATETTAQGFSSITSLTALTVSESTGEKPQSKVWTHDGEWWMVMPNGSGTHLWRLDGTAWTNILTLSPDTDTHADCKVAGTVVHILLYSGTSSELVSVEYVQATTTYQLWSIRPSTVAITLDSGVETATLDIDGNGRMWIASAGTSDINVRWSDSPYSSWSSAIAIATGVADDDICVVVALPGKIGVLWSNQNTERFGFKTHTDGDAPTTWSADEVPASQSALNVGLGMADDHLNVAVAADGTLYCAVKTSYDTPGYPKIALLIRQPGGTWDDLYNVSETGTRPIILLNETTEKIKIFYSSTEGGGNILYKESATAAIALSAPLTLISGTYNDVSSTKQNYTSEVVVLASNNTQVVGRLGTDDPPVIPDPPVLLTPADAATGVAVPPTLTWNASLGATSYQLQVSTVSNFTTTVYDQSGLAATSASVTGLLSNTLYYWRVNATNGAGTSGWSSVWSFTTAVPSGPLVCHLEMEEGAGTTLVDASPYNNNGTTVGSPTWTAGIIGQALSLNGTTQYATVTDAASLDITNTITLAAWIKPTVNNTQRIIIKVAGSTGYELFLEQPAPSRVSVRFNGNAAQRVNSTSSYMDFLNTWIHVAATYDGTTIRLYFNGVEEGTLTSSFSIATNNAAVGIGASDAGANKFTGLIDDARIYNTALTAAEILDLATIPPPDVPTLASPSNGATGVPVTPTLSWNAAGGADTYQAQVSTVSDFSSTVFDQSGIVPTSVSVTGLAGNTLYYWRANATNGFGTSAWSATWSFTTAPPPSGPLVCHLQMEEGAGTTLLDASPYINNGTTIANPTWTAGKIGQALSLNGTTQYATVTDAPSLDITTAITLAAWINPAVAVNTTQYVIKKAIQGGVAGTDDGYEISLSSAGKVFVRFNQATSGDLYRINSATSYPLNGSAWMHIAATYDQATGLMKLYVNGVQESGDLTGPAAIAANNLPLGIGAQGNGVSKFNGLLDDVRVYNTALTLAEIQALAATIPPAPVLASPADAATGIALPAALSWNSAAGATSYRVQVSFTADFASTEYDLGGIATTSTSVPGLSDNTTYYWRVNATNVAGTGDWSSVRSFTTAAPGAYAVDFNGSNNYVDCTNDASLQLTNFTLEAWIKIEGTGVAASTGTGGITDIVPIIAKGRGEAENPPQDVNYAFGYQLSTNKLVADFEDNATSANHPVFSNSTLGSCWTHVAATYDVSGVWKLYINGVLDQTTNLGGAFTPQNLSTVKACIGSTFNSTGATGGFFNGLIDEVRIWNVVRTDAEIAANYAAELSAGTGLAARYGLNTGSGAVAVNSAGGPNGSIAGTPVWVAGFVPGGTTATSLDFNGSSDYVTFGAAAGLNTTTFTLEAWIKIEGAGVTTTTSGAGGGGFEGATAAVPLVTKGRGEAESPANLNLNYFMGLVGNKLAADFEESTGPNHSVIGNATIPSNTWTHVAATYDPVSAEWNLYINGVVDKTLDIGSNISPVGNSIQHAAVGTAMNSTGVAGGFFNGLIDEVRIWNVVRTPAELQANYDEELSAGTGLLGRWGFNQGCGLIANNSVPGGVNGTLSSATGPDWVFDTPLPGNNAPDQAANPSPADEATIASLDPDLCVDVADDDNDNLRVRYYGRPKPPSNPPFTIVWLPDTQYYVEEPPAHGGTPAMFNAQTAWAVTNEVAENIVYVGQLGDCVEHGDYPSNPPLGLIEWSRAQTAMYALEPPDIPYGVCAGNHDQSPAGDPNGTTTGYNNTFGVAHFTGKSYYGGHYGANNDNHYELFSASGMDFMVISFEYDQTSAFNAGGGALDWAEALVVANPTKKVIVMSHYVLSDAGNFSTQGQYIYTRLKVYPNFIMMVGGHDPGGDGEARRSDVFSGNTVHTILSDYQGRSNGGNGLMRIFKFEPAANNVSVKTYSPHTLTYETDASSQFDLTVNLGGSPNPYVLIGELTGVASGSNACVEWADLDPCTEYEWYVETFDGIITTTSPVWTFTTPTPSATISYPGNPYSTGGGTATLNFTGSTGGTYSAAPAGLTLNASNGDVTLASSTPGAYTVTYTIAAAGNCPEVTATADITVTSGVVPPAITVKGNNTVIANRSLSASPADHTDFGSANVSGGTVTRTFTIENIANGLPLALDGVPSVTIADRDAADFSVLTMPATPIAGGGNTTFTIEFNPSAAGLRSAIVIITHKDLPENPFVFTINGTGM